MFLLMEFKGTVGQLMDELEAALRDPLEGRNFINIALHPPRIIRAAMDYKIDHPDEEIGELYVENALRLGLSIYSGQPDAVETSAHFRDTLVIDRFSNLGVAQTADAPTWHATDPDRSFDTAQKLRYQLEHPEILFIALGHGGVAAGMDVFLYYSALTGSTNSQFYAVRFSRRKHFDISPQISKLEFARLRNMARDRQVVVFDEDIVSGDTLEIAADTFADILAPLSHPVITVNNMRFGGKTKRIFCYKYEENYKVRP